MHKAGGVGDWSRVQGTESFFCHLQDGDRALAVGSIAVAVVEVTSHPAPGNSLATFGNWFKLFACHTRFNAFEIETDF